jgi:hypothetical protein
VARIVALELGLFTRLRRKGDRAAELQDHLGHGFAQSPNLVVVFVEILGDMAGLGIAHVDVQERGACVVAVHRRLNLLIPSDGKVLLGGDISRHPHGAIGRRRNHQRGLVLGQ